MGEKSRPGWNIPVCLRECKNRDKECNACFRFSKYAPIGGAMSDSLKSKLMKLCATRFEMSTQDYVDKILKLIEEALPVEQKLPKKFTKGELAILAKCVGGHIWKTGFNACLSEMRRKLVNP